MLRWGLSTLRTVGGRGTPPLPIRFYASVAPLRHPRRIAHAAHIGPLTLAVDSKSASPSHELDLADVRCVVTPSAFVGPSSSPVCLSGVERARTHATSKTTSRPPTHVAGPPGGGHEAPDHVASPLIPPVSPASRLKENRNHTPTVPLRVHNVRPTAPLPSDLLHTFLYWRNLASPTPTKYTADTLISLYLHVKSRSELHCLTSSNKTILISLLGSLSISSPGQPLPDCVYIQPFASQMDKHSFRPHWSVILELVGDKEGSGSDLSHSDRYWAMRAHIETARRQADCRSPSHPISADIPSAARVHYSRLFPFICDPEVHLPYLEALVSHGSTCLHETTEHICALMSRLEWCHPLYVEFFFHIALRYGNTLPKPLKSLLLSTLSGRLAKNLQGFEDTHPVIVEEKEKGTERHVPLTCRSLVRCLSDAIFSSPECLAVSLHAQAKDWLISTGSRIFSLDPADEGFTLQWNNLLLLGMLHTDPDAHPPLDGAMWSCSHPNVTRVEVDWQVVLVLGLLDKSFGGNLPISDDTKGGIRQLLSTVWQTWVSVDDDCRPPFVVASVLSIFLRLSGIIGDPHLKNTCHNYFLSSSLCPVDLGRRRVVESVIIEHMVASVGCGTREWDSLFSPFGDIMEGDASWRSTIGCMVLCRLMRRRSDSSEALFLLASRSGITLSGEVMFARGRQFLSLGHLDPAIHILTDNRLSDAQISKLFGHICLALAQRRSVYLHPQISAALVDVLGKISVASLFQEFRGGVEYICIVLSRCGFVKPVFSTVQAIHQASPTHPSKGFYFRYLKVLLTHRQYRLAARFVASVIKSRPYEAPLWHSRLLYALFWGRASRMASRTATILRQVAPTRFPYVSPTRLLYERSKPNMVASLWLLRRLGTDSNPTFIRYALHMTLQAGRIRAALKLFDRVRSEIDPPLRTVLGNMILHTHLLRRSVRNARQVRKILSSLDSLIKEHGFIPDRVTANIVVKAILRWDTAVDADLVRGLFDHLIRNGYPAGSRGGKAPFGTAPSAFPHKFRLPTIDQQLSFKRHVRPLYRMFIKAFHLRGDFHGAKVVIGILRDVKRQKMGEMEIRERARQRGRRRVIGKYHTSVEEMDVPPRQS
ncbi:hypothetical protein JAAARDRAFT_207324 [Jaapia argillacea MUCL 33604]|uniref:Uncharacterized protein n=1 Tax=Jaapia argillacea MUCL 33604 TaxID=933084 RepID=A0A067Q0F8_9AGAM|nr:hypothetical protein JAAARDRAFT_207324 [Jaapia argillacea MUCL 33604]